MPKIPLYEQQTTIGTARGVTFSPTLGQNLIDAQTKAENAITDGVFNIMEETAQMGADYLERKTEQKTKETLHAYTLFENDLDAKIEEIKKQATEDGLSAADAYTQKVEPYIKASLDEWSKKTGYSISRDVQERFELKSQSINKRELLYVEGIENQKAIDTGVQLANNLFKQEQFEEGRAIIDGLDLTEEQKRQYKSRGMHDYYAYKMDSASSLEEIQEIVKQFEGDENLSFASESSLKRLIRSAESNFLTTRATPAVKDAKELLKDNQLTNDWIDDSSMTDAEKSYFKAELSLMGSQYSNSTFYRKGEKILDANGKNITKDLGIENSVHLDQHVQIMTQRLLMGQTEDPLEDLKTIYSLLTSTDADGTRYFSPSYAERHLDRLTKVIEDPERNGTFLTGGVPNTYNDVEIRAINLLISQFENIQGAFAGEELEGFGNALIIVEELLDGLRENEGVYTVKDKETGETHYYNYDDEVMNAVDQALAPFRIRVSEEMRKKYFDGTYKTELDKDEAYLSDEQLIDTVGLTQEEVTKKLNKQLEEERVEKEDQSLIDRARREQAEASRNRSGRFGIGL